MLFFPARCTRLLPVLSILLIAGAALADDLQQTFEFVADELVLVDLVGEVRVEAATGDRYQVQVVIRGDDAEPGLLDVVLEEGRKARLEVQFPVKDHRTYVYPDLGRGNSTTVWQPDQDGDASWWEKVWHSLGGEKITVRGSGRGLEVWADVTVRVPADRATKVYLGAGDILAAGVDGKLVLDTHSGPIVVDSHRGELVCDTGSGRVKVRDIDGPLLVDTGSGSVKVENQQGGSLKVDTGSGSVRINGADTDDLYVDTGSGSVTAVAVKADQARIDTGSGSVELVLDRLGTGRFVLDTGSGSVRLELPDDASAMIYVDTGSGGIKARHPAGEVLHTDRGEMKLRIGDGKTKVVIDTGSGGVTIAGR